MIKLQVRAQPSGFWTFASPLLALLITVLLGVLLFSLLGKDPVRGLQMFFWEPLKSSYALGELVVKATPLLLIALGLAVCFRSNVWNIGAEGQYIIGAVCAGGVALLAEKDTGSWILAAVILAGVLGGMVWAGITALLRDRFNANEILVSLMMVYVAVQVLGILVYGPWKDPLGYNFPQTKNFDAITRIPRLMSGSRMTIGVLFALIGVGVFVPHPRRFCAASRWTGTGSGALRRFFSTPGFVDCAAGVWRHGRAGRGAGGGRADRAANALRARRLRFCSHHRGLCGALASGGHGVFQPVDEHVLYRRRASAIAPGPAQVADRCVPGALAI